jgi:hypothetical protein
VTGTPGLLPVVRFLGPGTDPPSQRRTKFPGRNTGSAFLPSVVHIFSLVPRTNGPGGHLLKGDTKHYHQETGEKKMTSGGAISCVPSPRGGREGGDTPVCRATPTMATADLHHLSVCPGRRLYIWPRPMSSTSMGRQRRREIDAYGRDGGGDGRCCCELYMLHPSITSHTTHRRTGMDIFPVVNL